MKRLYGLIIFIVLTLSSFGYCEYATQNKDAGIINIPVITISTNTTQFNISDGSGKFVDYTNDPDNPSIFEISWDTFSFVNADFLTTEVGTFLGISSNVAIVQQVEDFDRDQLNYILRVGRISHFNKTNITGTFDFPLIIETDLDFAEYVMSRGTIKLKGAELSADGSDLAIAISSGIFCRIGAGDIRERQNFPRSFFLSSPTFIPAWRDTDNTALLSSATTQIDTTKYDNGSGTLQTVDDGNYCNVYIYFFPYANTQTIFQIYGHDQHVALQEAVNVAGSTDFFVPIDIRGGVLLGCISIRKGETNLTQAIANEEAFITLSNKEGEIFGIEKGLETSAQMSLKNNTTQTDIPATNAWVAIKDTNWVGTDIERMSFTSDGFIKYIGTGKVKLLLDGNIDLEPATATKSLNASFACIGESSTTVTFTNATNIINETATPRQNGDIISFRGTPGTLPAELRTDILYYVVNKLTDSFQVSYSSGGATVAFTDDGTPPNAYKTTDICGATARATIAAGQSVDIIPQALILLPTNSECAVFVRNTNDAVNILVNNAYYRIKK
jgi:hypothetical protein